MGSVSDLRDTALGDAQNTRGVPLQEQNQAADLSSGTPNYANNYTKKLRPVENTDQAAQEKN